MLDRTTRTSPTIRLLAQQELPVAAGICARAMRDSPIHVVVFGAKAQRRERRLTHFLRACCPMSIATVVFMGLFLRKS